MKSAAAMIAPELPAEIQPSALFSLHMRAQTLIDESSFARTACAGCSSIAITCVQGTSWSRGCESSKGWTEDGRPTSEMSIPYSVAACAAPCTTCAGAKSPPMASTAIRMSNLYVEVADALGVRLNVLFARLHVRPHQLFEGVVGRSRVFHVYLQQHPRGRVHRRLPQLLGIHLTETLHPRRLGVFAQLTERLVALAFGVAPDDLLALEHFEQWRLRHVQIALLDDRGKVAVKEREQKGADVAAVDVGVSHRDHAVVAHLLDVEVVADAGAHRGDQGANLVC